MSTLSTPSPLLPLAKRRALRRRSAGGGTMFIVAMTLAVLSTIGAWALQSAALEVKMAGYERQSTQTHYLAEYGVLSAVQDVNPTMATAVLGVAQCGNAGTYSSCLSVPCMDFTQNPPVAVAGCAEIANPVPLVSRSCLRLEGISGTTANFIPSGTNALDPADGGVAGGPGSLGATSTVGNFSAEITEVGPAPAGNGFSGNSMGFYWATLTAYGQTTTPGGVANEGDEQLRARVKVGPITPLGSCQ